MRSSNSSSIIESIICHPVVKVYEDIADIKCYQLDFDSTIDFYHNYNNAVKNALCRVYNLLNINIYNRMMIYLQLVKKN